MSESRGALRVESSADTVSVFREGSTTPLLVQNAVADRRPFIHPITVPGGEAAVTEDAPSHHPWQHGLYIGLNDVDGFGFWSEGLSPKNADTDGTFHPRLVGSAQADGDRASWTVETEYRDPQGAAVLEETQEWTVQDRGESVALDLVWTLRADHNVTFGEFAYGGLFLRMPFRREVGGVAFNSAGQQDSDAEGQRANWVAAQMQVPGYDGEALVALLDHPSNLEHPVPWRVDNELGISPSPSIAGAWQLTAGEARVFRYRVLVFSAPVAPATIDEAWSSFSERVTV
jgi:Methane oxygenase PmoA